MKDLREKQYIDWIYDADNSSSKSTPAIYFLSTNGIRQLRQRGYPEAGLRKRYKDNDRQQDFINQCLLLADCAIHLEAKNTNPDDPVHYDYVVESDYLDPENAYAFLAESEFAHPSLAFTKTIEGDDERATYFVELFDITTPRYMVKKKTKNYVEYLASDEWEEAQQEYADLSDEPPIILIACPTLAEMIYAKRYAKRQLDDLWDDQVPENIKIRVSTIDKVKTKGMTAVIWEDV